MHHVVKYRRVSRSNSLGPLAAKSWGHLTHGMKVLEVRLELLKVVTTLVALIVFLALMPIFITVYAVIKIWRSLVQAWAMRRLVGVQEITGVTLNTALESAQAPAISTLLLCLKGEVSVHHVRNCVKRDVIGQLDESGQLEYPNFRRQLVEVMGYYAWMDYPEFTISQHVIEAPRLYSGRSLTERNIQEYISELMSSPLPSGLPPWQIQVVVTHGQEPQTWILARAHHHLATRLSLPNLLKSAIPDPWQQHAARSHNIFAAPASLRQLGKASKIWIMKILYATSNYFTALKQFIKQRGDKFKSDVMDEVKCTSQNKDNLSLYEKFMNLILSGITVIWQNFLFTLKGWLRISIDEKLTKYVIMRSTVTCLLDLSKYLFWLISNITVLPLILKNWSLYAYACILIFWHSEELDLILKASAEAYWILRAFVSLPRLLLEEALSLNQPPVSLGWTGRKRTFSRNTRNGKGLTASWSDGVPLSTAHGVKGATGATMSEILLTATSGAIRDYLRNCGLPVPETLNCTVPVFSQRWAEMNGNTKTNPGLVSLSLPTGAADAQTALRTIRSTMNKVKRYPEQYLARLWFIKNVVKFIPKKLLSPTLKMLTGRYPVLLTKLVGPKTPVQFWEYDLLHIYYWRPPQAHAALSICVTSYCGHANLGVLGDRRVVASASNLTQAFVTHLNELAVDSGVRPERNIHRRVNRSCSHNWSRSNSLSTPPSSPSSTPPSTPTRTGRIYSTNSS